MLNAPSSADGSSEPTLNLDQLAAALPKPDRAPLLALLDEGMRQYMTEQGAQITSARVLVDATRIFGLSYDFYRGATVAQKASLVGFSLELLALAVSEALRLRELSQGTADSQRSEGATAGQREATLRETLRRGILWRDQAVTVLKGLCGPATALRERVTIAAGNAETPVALAQGLKRLAALGREILADKKGSAAAMAKLRGVKSEYFDTLERLATQVREADDAQVAPSRLRPNQGELDLRDGINLYLIGEVVRVFDAAHDLDPTVPRLIPTATRRLLGKRSRSTAKDPLPEPAPNPA